MPTNYIIHDTNVLPLAKSVSNLRNEVSDHYCVCVVPNSYFHFFLMNQELKWIQEVAKIQDLLYLGQSCWSRNLTHYFSWLKLVVLPSSLKKSGRGAWLEFCGFPTSLSTQMGLWTVLYKNLPHLCSIYSVLGTVLRMSVTPPFFF